MASSSRHNFYYVEELVYGVTPDAPEFKAFPITGTTLGLTKNTIQSNLIRADRQISDVRDGTRQIGGDINTELSFGVCDDFLAAALCGTWDGNTLKAGTTRRSFTIARHFSDIEADGEPYEIYTGVELMNVAITIAIEDKTTLTFSTVGSDVQTLTELPEDYVLTEEVTQPELFTSFDGDLLEGGNPIGIATELSFTLENGLEPRFALGSNKSISNKIGRSNLSGQLGAYFENHALLNKFYQSTKSSIKIDLFDDAGNKYTLNAPRIVYSGGQPDVDGDSDIILGMPFQAIYDATTQTNFVIEKAVK